MTEPPPLPKSVQPAKPRWFRRAWFHIPLLLLMPYLQVPLMWIVKAFSLKTRIIITVLGCGILFCSILWDPVVRLSVQTLGNWTRSVTQNGANEPETSAEVETITGRVLSVTDDGVLVIKFGSGDAVFFVRGRFSYVDDDWVNIKAYPSGTYRYTTAIGSVATVRAYRAKQ